MGRAVTIVEGVYLIGGPDITRSEDAAAYLIDFGKEQVMIDSGAGGSAEQLERNILDLGLDPRGISTLILTHRHIDHIGGAPHFRKKFGCRILMHEDDAEAVEKGDRIQTVADWYQTAFPPTPVDIRLSGDGETLLFSGESLHLLHAPGHTPGSLSLYLDRDGRRILFGQDIHGPFFPRLGADLAAWRQSMEKLLDLRADLLCEGHFGIYQSREEVERYIREHLRRNSG